MRKMMVLVVLTGVFYFGAPRSEVSAMDPVTISLLAPVAIKVLQTASPYIIKALVGTGKTLAKMGLDTLNILRLPLGFFEVTVLAPWFFKRGMMDILKGSVAPVKLTLRTLTLPLAMCGANINF